MAALEKQEEEYPKCEARNTVIVTGFGPFKGHPVNASWEAVSLLPTTGIDEELGICLVVEQIPVAYDDVEEKIPALWHSHKPLLVVHVGVSHSAQKITLETVAQKSGYNKSDIYGQTPACKECCTGTSPTIECGLDVNDVINRINATSIVQTEMSRNAGRYLCEYTFYKSMSIDNSRTIFIHVPPLDKPYSDEQLAQGLAEIIRCLVEQLRIKYRRVSSA